MSRISTRAPLVPRREKFARLIADGRTLPDAFRQCYPKSCSWKPHSVERSAKKLAADVRWRIHEIQQDAAAIVAVNQSEVLAEALRLAVSDIGKIIGEGGKVLLPHELDAATRAAVAKFKIDEYGRIEYTFWDKNAALDKLFRHLGLYKKDNEQQPPAAPTRIELVALQAPPADEGGG